MDAMNMYGGANYGQQQQYMQIPQQYNNQYAQPQNQQYNNPQMQYQNQPQYVQSQQYSQSQNQQNQNKIPHPTEFWASENSETICFIEDNLKAPDLNEYYGAGGMELLMSLHSKFSRFKFSLYKIKEKKYLNFNLHPEKLAGLEAKFKAITNLEISQAGASDKQTSDVPLAYTVPISTGKLKGKTPAELILEVINNPQALQQVFNDLESQKNFLLQNVAKYPKNQLQIDAILNSYELYNNQQLVQRADVSTSKIPLLSEFKIPNAKQQDNEGYTKTTAFEIYYTKGEAYPFTVEITNAKARPTFHQNGTITANMKEAKEKESASFNMSFFDFSDMLSEMKEQKKAFERELRKERRNIGVAEALRQISKK